MDMNLELGPCETCLKWMKLDLYTSNEVFLEDLNDKMDDTRVYDLDLK